MICPPSGNSSLFALPFFEDGLLFWIETPPLKMENEKYKLTMTSIPARAPPSFPLLSFVDLDSSAFSGPKRVGFKHAEAQNPTRSPFSSTFKGFHHRGLSERRKGCSGVTNPFSLSGVFLFSFPLLRSTNTFPGEGVKPPAIEMPLSSRPTLTFAPFSTSLFLRKRSGPLLFEARNSATE